MTIQASQNESFKDSKSTAKEVKLSALSVLIADDNEINRILLRAQITKIEANITEAIDGVQALEFIQKMPFDLILLDLNMPGLSGKQVMQKLRKNPMTLNKNTPVIAITAHASAEQIALLSEIGFSDFLIKPILEKQLKEIINQYIYVSEKQSFLNKLL